MSSRLVKKRKRQQRWQRMQQEKQVMSQQGGQLGQDYGKLLNQHQQYTAAQQMNTESTPRWPTREHITQRIKETEALLSLLREVDAILTNHPDLERLVGTLHKMGSL